VLLVVFCGSVFVLGWLRAEKETAPVPTQRDMRREIGVPVETATVATGQLDRPIRLFGMIKGDEQAEIISTSPNILEKLHVSVGDEVRRGKVLASMRDMSVSPMAFRHQPLKAQWEATEADLERVERLFNEGAVTQQQVDHARAQAKANRADYEAAVNSIRITTPLTGVVTRIDYRPGEMVPNDRPLMQVAVIDTVAVDLMAEANDVAWIEVGQSVDVTAAALPGRTFRGTVVERSLGAYPVLNQFRVRVAIPNEGHELLPGYPVRADILVSSSEQSLLVPVRALVEDDGQPAVWVAADGRAQLRPVGVGLSDGDQASITGELAVGDKVVTLGKETIPEDGAPLIIVDEE